MKWWTPSKHQQGERPGESQSVRQRECTSTVATISVTQLTFPAVQHWRMQPPTCSHNFRLCKKLPQAVSYYYIVPFIPAPPQNYSLIPNLSTATPSPNPFRCAFYCEMEPFSITYSAAGPLFISLVFFLMFFCSLSLSGWELICEAQLLVDCPQRTPGHNRKKQNKKTSVKYSYSTLFDFYLF